MYAGGHKQDESMIAAACPGVPETADTFDSEANLTTPHFRPAASLALSLYHCLSFCQPSDMES